MKFLLIALDRTFYRNEMTSLAAALIEKGHEARYVTPDKKSEYLSWADVVIEVNTARSEEIPKTARHIAWVQDYKQGHIEPDYEAACLSNDMIYTFGEASLLGAPQQDWKHYRGSLVSAVRENQFSEPKEPIFDLSIAGFIPEYIEKWGAPPYVDPVFTQLNIVDKMAHTMEEIYQPLTGDFDPPALMRKLKKVIPAWDKVERYAGVFTHDYSRMMNRRTIARLMLSVSKDTVFMGYNWERWPEFSFYARENTSNQEEIVDLYRSTRINVHDNITGFGLHSRVLEAIASGGFIMANGSEKYHGRAGQMSETFEPMVHYGEYNADTFSDVARFWLENVEKRKKAVVESRKVVLAKHLWSNRAAQILGDLGYG